MGWMGFLTSLVSSLAWPSLVLAAILIFRQPLADLIARIRSVSLGNVEVEIDQLAAEVTAQSVIADAGTARANVIAHAPAVRVAPAWSDLAITTAEADPQSAVLAAFSAVDQKVREIARPYGQIQGFNEAVVKLAGAELFSADLVPVFLGLSEIRNRVAHGSKAVDTATAKTYIETAVRALGLISAPAQPDG